MKQQKVQVYSQSSIVLDDLQIIISWRYVGHELVIGWPGRDTTINKLEVGDAFLFETARDGIVEIRALSTDVTVTLLLTPIAPNQSVLAGTDATRYDDTNKSFTQQEIHRIIHSLKSVKEEIHSTGALSPEQFEFLSRKLGEIGAASNRLGRKDWINYAAGTLTSVFVSAAFAPDAAKAVLSVFANALSWLVEGGWALLPAR